jgi:hypothetical protein
MKEDLLKLCGFELTQKLDLLYRGSLHGFGASDFHAKCDNIPKTLTLIRTTNGNIFGGYTEATWDKYEQHKTDKNAFIFSLVNGEKRPVRVNVANGNESNAIYCGTSYGPTFGGGHDFKIAKNPNTSNSNYSRFGHTYSLPNYPPGSHKAESFLAGSYYFTIDEIEVFRRN